MRKLSLGIVAAVLLVATGSMANGAMGTKKLVSAVLEGRRVSALTCEVINKSGADLDGIEITLKRPDATVLAGLFACPTVANGETCALTYDVKFPDNDVEAYCHVELPDGKFVRGSLRFVDSQNATRAESTLEGDLHGKLAAIADQIDALSHGFPDDGEAPQSYALEGAALSYQDNGDGTVTDLNTGYMYAQKTGTPGVDVDGVCLTAPHDVNTRCTWNEATTDYLDVLNNTCEGAGATDCTVAGDAACGADVCGYAGHRDWQIPDIKQLFGIVDHSIAGPKISADFGPTKASVYWSSTTFFGQATALHVNFANGLISIQGKNQLMRVRAARNTH